MKDDPGFVPLESLGLAPAMDGATRRRFLELAGASLAMAAAGGCTRQPAEFIMPYVDAPEQVIPGRPSYYATANLVNALAQGIVVESHLGRPTKVEGNPNHPASLGATGVHAQACVLDLYDPDRLKQVFERGDTGEWNAFTAWLGQALALVGRDRGEGLHLLTGTVTSPTLGAQLTAALTAFPNARWHQYEPIGPHAARSAARQVFGRPVNTYYRLDRADVILALDADFLASGAASSRYAHDYAMRRRVRGSHTAMNRLYAVECEMTSTGGKAEHRLPLGFGEIEKFARDLHAAIVSGGAARSAGPHAAWLAAVAQDLMAHRGASAVIPGEAQTPAVHALAHAMNAALGNNGATVIHTEPVEIGATDQVQSLRELVAAMDAGKVRLLLMLGGNPVYDAPYDLDFAGKLAKVPDAVHLSQHYNETSALARWAIPERHFLEDWGDARAFDGTVTILQPLIQPLYDGHSALELLDILNQRPGRSSYEIVRAYWGNAQQGGDFEQWWRQSVRAGMVSGSALPAITPAASGTIPAPSAAAGAGGLEVVFRPDPYLLDGRYANNAWLQELPRPVTKLTWDNAVHVSPRTAQRLGLENQQVVELSLDGRSVRGSLWVARGQADDTAVVHLGFGRTRAGHVGKGAGFNAYTLRRSDAMQCGAGAALRMVGGAAYRLATTQTHHTMEGRDMVISAPVGAYLADPEFVGKRTKTPEKVETLYPIWNYTGYAWGMSVDLTACVNCMACVIACQAENNIPVVGKAEVLNNREMHWLRVDTYYEGTPEQPELRYQPVPCMQCEQAPCELVCPVGATVHSADGLNDMTYNRCVGTRYCSNNCPYKVRRFNFLLFNDWESETLKMQRNPDVTVRARGVMEKCTYCVQRIREAEIRSTTEDRFIRDGEIQTACQQVCPTRAITFGDINNPANQVARLKAEKLNYGLLAELNTRPRTTYLAELRNPNPDLKGREGS